MTTTLELLANGEGKRKETLTAHTEALPMVCLQLMKIGTYNFVSVHKEVIMN